MDAAGHLFLRRIHFAWIHRKAGSLVCISSEFQRLFLYIFPSFRIGRHEPFLQFDDAVV